MHAKQDLEAEGFIDVGNPYHMLEKIKWFYIIIFTCMHIIFQRDSVRFLFGPLINKDLAQFADEWNAHRIRYSRMAEVPHGIPNIMYTFPELNSKLYNYNLRCYTSSSLLNIIRL